MKKKNLRRLVFLNLLILVCFGAHAQSDQIKRSYISPTRIVWQSDPGKAVVKNSDLLLKASIHQADLYGTGHCELINGISEKASILLDFGKEIQGGIQLITGGFPGKEPINVRLRFGESVSEAMSEIGEDGATNDHAMRDFEVQLPWMGKIEIGSTGFRFVRIDLQDNERKLFLKEVSAISELRDIPYLGSFECNDQEINEIWQTGAYTVHLNMQEFLWDGIKRDRLVWVGDMHPEVMTINAVFGYNEVVPKTLDYIREVTPATQWMNGISSYTMWWIILQKEWYLVQGDENYLKNQHSYLKAILTRLCTMVDENGEEQLDGWRFLDWPSSEDKVTIKAGYQALLLLSLEAGAYLCDQLNDNDVANLCNETVARMYHAKLPDAGMKQGAALLSLAGLMDENAASDVILEGMAEGFSTFYGFYMLEALAKAGKYSEAISIIKQYWGGMLSLGATSFWEDFNINWLENAGRIDELPSQDKIDVHRTYGDYCYEGLRHSFCHGWASGPTPWLTSHVLGVKVLEPACAKIKIQPNLGDLQWVRGTFPTPHGVVHISHTKDAGGKVKTEVRSPEKVTVITN